MAPSSSRKGKRKWIHTEKERHLQGANCTCNHFELMASELTVALCNFVRRIFNERDDLTFRDFSTYQRLNESSPLLSHFDQITVNVEYAVFFRQLDVGINGQVDSRTTSAITVKSEIENDRTLSWSFPNAPLGPVIRRRSKRITREIGTFPLKSRMKNFSFCALKHSKW